MPAHVGAGVPARISTHRGLSPRSYDVALGRSNHLYSVAALTNAAGSVVERYRYDTFGNRTVLAPDGVTTRAASSYNQNRGFTGYYQDKETGLYNARARMYSPNLGRWLQRDAIGYVDGPSLYNAYFVPFAVDPFGEQVDWHHLLPQKWRTLFAEANIDIDGAVYGVILDKENHQKLHSTGWNNDWEKFFQTNTNPTAAQVQAQLSAMKNKYSGILRNGWRARWTYGDRSKMAKRISAAIQRKIEARLLKRGGGVCAKKVPLLGTLLVVLSVKDQIEDKGWLSGLAYSAVDAVPVVNLVLIPFEAKQAYDDFNHEGFQAEVEDAVSSELLNDAVPFEEKVGT